MQHTFSRPSQQTYLTPRVFCPQHFSVAISLNTSLTNILSTPLQTSSLRPFPSPCSYQNLSHALPHLPPPTPPTNSRGRHLRLRVSRPAAALRQPVAFLPKPLWLPHGRRAPRPRRPQGLPQPLRLPPLPSSLFQLLRLLRRRARCRHPNIPAQLRPQCHRHTRPIHRRSDDHTAVRCRGCDKRHVHHELFVHPRPQSLRVLRGESDMAAA